MLWMLTSLSAKMCGWIQLKAEEKPVVSSTPLPALKANLSKCKFA